MRSILLLTFTLLGFVITSFAQPSSTSWSQYKWLIGDWVGEGGGKPGEGKGWFSLKEDLSGKVLVRKNHSEYPPANGAPGIVHDDLMIIYNDPGGNPAKATYFDNEGHHINYSISSTDSTLVFISDKIPNVSVLRLTYELLDNDSIDIKFEMSQDGIKFNLYTEGKCKRKK